MDFHDLNKSFPKDKFPTSFIDQILYECIGSDIFSFRDDVSGYNQILIFPKDQHKKPFICPWGTFSYEKMPFGIKNVGATFQWAIMFTFHDLKHIVKSYLDDITTHSCNRAQHLLHLCLVFERCLHYRILLNPQKFIFCVTSGCLVGFIISTKGIMVNPLKVEALN
jgi:hypothetical protein